MVDPQWLKLLIECVATDFVLVLFAISVVFPFPMSREMGLDPGVSVVSTQLPWCTLIFSLFVCLLTTALTSLTPHSLKPGVYSTPHSPLPIVFGALILERALGAGRLDSLEAMLGLLTSKFFVRIFVGFMRKAFKNKRPTNLFKVRHGGKSGGWCAVLVEPGHYSYIYIERESYARRGVRCPPA